MSHELSHQSGFPACGTSIGGYPHGFSLHERCFGYFLERYYQYFRRARPTQPWLPRRWDTSLAHLQSSVSADLLGMRIELLSNADQVKLVVRLGARGTFKVDGQTFATKGWSFKLLTPLKFERASAVSGDQYPYYAKAYQRVQANYRHVHQLALDLEGMATSPQAGDIDFGDADLDPEQSAAFLLHIQALMQPSRAHGRFVLLYLGGERQFSPNDELQSYEQLLADTETDVASNDEVWRRLFYYPRTYVLGAHKPDSQPGELHFAYTVGLCRASGTGSLGRALVSDGVEGVFCLGRDPLFHRLAGQGSKLQAHESAGRVTHLSRSWGSGDLRIETLSAGDQAKLAFRYSFRPVFNLRFPVIGSRNGETYPVKIEYNGARSYEVTLALDKTAIGFITVDTSKPMEDRWTWTDHIGGRTDLAHKYPEFMKCINLGYLTDELKRNIAVACARLGDECFGCLVRAYQAAIDACRDAAARARERHTAELRLGLDAEQFFVQLPESFTCQKLRFDQQYNLLFDLRMDRLTDLQEEMG